MRITRRKFLKSGTAAAALGAGVVLAPQIARAQRSSSGSISSGGPRGGFDSFNAIGNYSQADFEALIGTEFNLLSDASGHHTVTLTAVRSSNTMKDSRTDCFSLLFKGPDWQDVRQDVYYVTHNTLGYFHALMSPVRVNGRNGGICYEVVVNRLV